MEIELWQSNTGSCPVRKFLRSVPPDVRVRTMREINHLAAQGLNLMRTAKMKKLSGHKNLYELKFRYNKVSIRILFTIKDNVAHLLEGFIKKDATTRLQHITNAARRARFV
jgi:phage-related protein